MSAYVQTKKFSHELEMVVEERTKELQQANEKLAHMATIDGLTQVWNRNEMNRRIHQFSRNREDSGSGSRTIVNAAGLELKPLHKEPVSGAPYTICYIDLDNFKTINDTFGHALGDQVLRIFAQYLLNHSRDRDELFRAGGDEFVFYLPNTDEKGAEVKGERIIEGMEECNSEIRKIILKKFGTQRAELFSAISCSIGIAVEKGSGSRDLEEHIKKADLALLRAKELGKNRYFFYNTTLENRGSSLFTTE